MMNNKQATCRADGGPIPPDVYKKGGSVQHKKRADGGPVPPAAYASGGRVTNGKKNGPNICGMQLDRRGEGSKAQEGMRGRMNTFNKREKDLY